MNLNHIRIFAKVAEAGSFSEAARRLKLPKSQVSRQVRLLEESLGVRLFERTTRQVRLTESGRMYYQRSHDSLNGLEDANAFVSGLQQELNGLIRVTAPVDLGPHVIVELVAEFLQEHSQLEIELNCTQRVVNLIEEQYDLGIRIGGSSLPDSSFIARKLGVVSSQLFVSPSLLSKLPLLEHPEQLGEFPGVLFQHSQTPIKLQFFRGEEKINVEFKIRLRSDDFNSVLQGILSGLGIGILPYFMAQPYLLTGELKTVLTEWKPLTSNAFAIYPSRRFLQPKVQKLLDHFSLRFPESVSCPK